MREKTEKTPTPARIETLCAHLRTLGLTPPADFAGQLLAFEERLLETNRVMNLTAITDPEEMVKKHYWDSIFPLAKGYFAPDERIVDVGCGAGFPSLPLKLCEPRLDFTLLDSLQKRLRFLDGVIAQMNLSGIRTLHLRAEDAGHRADYREQFDKAVARAVAELSKLCEYCLPLVKVGGALIAYKGAGAQEELDRAQGAIAALGGRVEELIQYTLPEEDDRRALIIIRKVRATPKQYPRRPMQIRENPL